MQAVSESETKSVESVDDSAIDHPAEFICPIGLHLMKRPVLLVSDGHTYDEQNIDLWLTSSNISPITRTPLTSKQYVLNRSLQHQIDDYVSRDTFMPCSPKAIQNALLLRVQFIGSANVGKSSICRYLEFARARPTMPTIGCEFSFIKMKGKNQTNNQSCSDVCIRLQDMAGQFDNHGTVTKQCYRNVHGIIFCCSVDSISSVVDLEKHWVAEVNEYAPDYAYCIVLLHKYDLLLHECIDEHKRCQYKLAAQQAQQFAKNHHYPLYNTSVINGQHIHHSLRELIDRILSDHQLYTQIKLENEPLQRKKSIVLNGSMNAECIDKKYTQKNMCC